MTAILNPAQYVPPHAVAFANADGSAALVSGNRPLPVAMSGGVSVALPVTAAVVGTTTITKVAGPYIPVQGRSVMMTLSGTWSGSVQIMRSTDGGATLVPLTMGGGSWGVYSGNCCEPVWDESEAAASLWLQITVTAGSLTYRIAQ